MEKVLLKTENMKKQFGVTVAIDDVSITINHREIRGLIGENGSGKSTFSSMITGALKPDAGKMWLNGRPYEPKSLKDSMMSGISIVVQETGIINELSVAENIFMGREDMFGRAGTVNMKRIKQEAKKALDSIGARWIEPEAKAGDYSFEDKKLIEIAAALYQEPELLIVDETTTALSHFGREKIYSIMQELKEAGKSILFISHDLDELKKMCDVVDVLRDGKYVGTLEGEFITSNRMRQMMVGRELSGHFYRASKEGRKSENVVLEAENINYGILKNISFKLHEGEILGIGGLSDCGMHELCKILFGAIKPDSGTIRITADGKAIKSPKDAISHKIAYLPKDRDSESVLLCTSIKDNICLSSLDDLKKGFYISKRSENALTEKMTEYFEIKMQNITQWVGELSGGNKQKVAFSKWIANRSEIFIMDCPTRGIDIGVKKSIYTLMESLKEQGAAVVMVSEEMQELIGMADRCIVLKNGEVSGEFFREEGLEETKMIHAII